MSKYHPLIFMSVWIRYAKRNYCNGKKRGFEEKPGIFTIFQAMLQSSSGCIRLTIYTGLQNNSLSLIWCMTQ